MITSGATMRPRTGLLLGGRYELTERIAVGGMGEVWRATDRRLGRTVAAKVLRTELVGDEQFLARLRTEARNSAGLRHENIAMLLDHGEQERSGYIVMELVEGETLGDRLERRGTLPAAELVPILVQACRGLHAAHSAGVIHRDIKPANLILAPDGTVKLTDFGISLGVNQAPMTSAGMVMGTAQYLPPEQAMGRSATPAGDVYALGVLAYECLAGRRPFTGSTQVDIAFAHVNQPIPPLPTAVPAAVRAVVARMLAKDPAARPSSALACARELASAVRSGASAVPASGNSPRPATRTGQPRFPAAAPRGPVPRSTSPHAGDPGAPVDPPSGAAPGPTVPYAGRRTVAASTLRSAPRTGVPGRGRSRTGTPGGQPGAAAASGRPRWTVPTWTELAADRVWLTAMVVVLVVLLILVVATLGSLGDADSTTTAGPTSAAPSPSSTVKDF